MCVCSPERNLTYQCCGQAVWDNQKSMTPCYQRLAVIDSRFPPGTCCSRHYQRAIVNLCHIYESGCCCPLIILLEIRRRGEDIKSLYCINIRLSSLCTSSRFKCFFSSVFDIILVVSAIVLFLVMMG